MARPAERMNSAQKRELAIEFIRKIRAMDRNKLHELILGEAGEELAQFFLMYATDLMMREPQRATENASSLLLMVAVSFLLSRWLPYWAAFGIVAVANLVTGGTLTWSCTRRVMHDRVDLPRTAEEIRRDRRWLSSMKQGNRPAENALPQPVAIADRGGPSDAASR